MPRKATKRATKKQSAKKTAKKTKKRKLTKREREIESLNYVVKKSFRYFEPVKDMTVTEWAEKKRRLSRDTSAEPGLWRTSRTPYLREIMDCYTKPETKKIVIVAASQVGKTELELNTIGYIIDQDPGTILYIHPSLDEARKFSRQRLNPMFRECKSLNSKVGELKAKDSSNTILQKSFPGGSITLIGSNTPRALASTPVRYIIGDEYDRWAKSAGEEGNPWQLAERRQTTFYNRKAIIVSTPTIKGASAIEESYYQGTQERWCHQCPECGEYSELEFDNIKFEFETTKVDGKKVHRLTAPTRWVCPKCGCLVSEEIMRKQPAKWIAKTPERITNGVRSFWLNAFSSPWITWDEIVLKFLEVKDDPNALKVVWNTLFGKLWEERGELADEDTMLARREDYGKNEDGTPTELPDGVLVLTMGVDTQDNRLEYEVVGHGKFGETWGIKRGFIMGRPDVQGTWQRLDDIIDHVYRFKNGRGLKISITMIDSGGHFTQEVYEEARKRQIKRCFAIKGKGGEGIPYTSPPSKIQLKDKYGNKVKNAFCWLYTLGVDSGKQIIMSNLKVEETGAKYCHFPLNEAAGYNQDYFNGLLSEHLILANTKRGNQWTWEKLPGHQRNEPLDCRNYALAGLRIINPDMDALEARLLSLNNQAPSTVTSQTSASQAQPQRKRGAIRKRTQHDDW